MKIHVNNQQDLSERPSYQSFHAIWSNTKQRKVNSHILGNLKLLQCCLIGLVNPIV